MSSVSQDTDQIDKKELQQLLVNTILKSLDEEKMTVQDMRDASSFILEQMETIKTPFEYSQFLEKLTHKWNIFDGVLKEFKKKIHGVHEKMVMDKLASFAGIKE